MKNEKKINWLCKLFGHKVDLTEKTIFEIKKVALNKNQLKGKLVCQRCGKVLEVLN